MHVELFQVMTDVDCLFVIVIQRPAFDAVDRPLDRDDRDDGRILSDGRIRIGLGETSHGAETGLVRGSKWPFCCIISSVRGGRHGQGKCGELYTRGVCRRGRNGDLVVAEPEEIRFAPCILFY